MWLFQITGHTTVAIAEVTIILVLWITSNIAYISNPSLANKSQLSNFETACVSI